MGVAGSAPPSIVNLICVKIAWMGKTIASVEQPFHVIHVSPEPEHPKGRKGLTMASAWRQMSTADDAGMLVLDSDVAIEPTDLLSMVHHIGSDLGAVWTAPVRLWPRSTHLPSWVWGHRKPLPDGVPQEEALRLWQCDIDDPEWFTFCFTYLPRRLVEKAIEVGMKDWHYPYVDRNMHLLAKSEGIAVRVVRGGCHPKHINF